jgi:hypothetical protein
VSTCAGASRMTPMQLAPGTGGNWLGPACSSSNERGCPVLTAEHDSRNSRHRVTDCLHGPMTDATSRRFSHDSRQSGPRNTQALQFLHGFVDCFLRTESVSSLAWRKVLQTFEAGGPEWSSRGRSSQPLSYQQDQPQSRRRFISQSLVPELPFPPASAHAKKPSLLVIFGDDIGM